jgi:hypothetical protein
MKKILSSIAIVMLITCVFAFVFEWGIPGITVQAAAGTHLLSSSAGPENQAAANSFSTTTVAFILAGLACALFAIMALSLLLIDDPALRREAGISLERSEDGGR